MLQARDIMTTEVITVSPETLVSDLTKTLEGKNIGGVPVVDADGRLVGIVTQSDLVDRARDLGCAYAQGFFLCRPLERHAAEAFLLKVQGAPLAQLAEKDPPGLQALA